MVTDLSQGIEQRGFDFSAFAFSQSNLQDYLDCHRRFQLRYLLKVAWPAQQAEPAIENEQAIQQGEAFHRSIHQYFRGIPSERLTAALNAPPLRRWWQNFLQSVPASLSGGLRYPEISLSASLKDWRLLAKYDLIDLSQKVSIYDWKTSRNKPRRRWLAERVQTRLYPYLLVKAGAFLQQDQAIQPEQVQMVYWFSEFPDQPELFSYTTIQYETDEQHLTQLLTEITTRKPDEFDLTAQEERCGYCMYRSLCARGVRAGALDRAEESESGEGGFTFDFEQIAEIEF